MHLNKHVKLLLLASNVCLSKISKLIVVNPGDDHILFDEVKKFSLQADIRYFELKNQLELFGFDDYIEPKKYFFLCHDSSSNDPNDFTLTNCNDYLEYSGEFKIENIKYWIKKHLSNDSYPVIKYIQSSNELGSNPIFLTLGCKDNDYVVNSLIASKDQFQIYKLADSDTEECLGSFNNTAQFQKFQFLTDLIPLPKLKILKYDIILLRKVIFETDYNVMFILNPQNETALNLTVNLDFLRQFITEKQISSVERVFNTIFFIKNITDSSNRIIDNDFLESFFEPYLRTGSPKLIFVERFSDWKIKEIIYQKKIGKNQIYEKYDYWLQSPRYEHVYNPSSFETDLIKFFEKISNFGIIPWDRPSNESLSLSSTSYIHLNFSELYKLLNSESKIDNMVFFIYSEECVLCKYSLNLFEKTAKLFETTDITFVVYNEKLPMFPIPIKSNNSVKGLVINSVPYIFFTKNNKIYHYYAEIELPDFHLYINNLFGIPKKAKFYDKENKNNEVDNHRFSNVNEEL